jgi:hypothetical protein
MVMRELDHLSRKAKPELFTLLDLEPLDRTGKQLLWHQPVLVIIRFALRGSVELRGELADV